MANFFTRSPKHAAVADISQSMENVSLSSAMEVDSLAPATPKHAPLRSGFNRDNTTPTTSPTKSILHTSPLRPGRTPRTPQPPQPYAPPPPQAYAPPPPPPFGHPAPEALRSAKASRLTSVCQLYFLDYYCDMFDYVILRRERTALVQHHLMTDAAFRDAPHKQQLEWKLYIGRERALLRKRRLKPKHRDFQMITQVGQGGYGQVFLARKKDTREICALKVLNKKLLVKLDETRHVLTERDILTNTRLEWLVRLLYAFQDPEKVFLAMEFVPGGDFRTLLNNTGYLIPPHARFYLGEMFAAVDLLHQLGFTHRDLKPENFLIDLRGHIKLTDFGLAAGTVLNERIESMRIRLQSLEDLEHYTVPLHLMAERQKIFRQLQHNAGHRNLANSIVGLPDYMALEVLEGKSYDYTIDYWLLGCMLFEALCGYPPFLGLKQDETYYNLKNWRTALRRPQTKDGRYVFSDRTWQLITRLIAAPLARLRSFRQVQAQPYFSDVHDWERLRDKTPPFTPQLDNEEDAGYFDDFDDEESMQKYKDVFARQEHNELLLERGAKSAAANNFIGFTFKHRMNAKLGEVNLLGGARSRLDPLATLY